MDLWWDGYFFLLTSPSAWFEGIFNSWLNNHHRIPPSPVTHDETSPRFLTNQHTHTFSKFIFGPLFYCNSGLEFSETGERRIEGEKRRERGESKLWISF